jgi:formate dehydrogenase maturation protein FdhE
MGVPTLNYDAYRRLFPAAGRALALHEDLRKLLHHTRDLPALPSLDVVAIEDAWQSGQPIVGRLRLGPSAEPLRQILRQVAQVMRQHLPQVGGLEVLGDTQRISDSQLLDMANDVASGDPSAMEAAAKVTGAHATGVAFALSLGVSVFYHAVRRHLPTELDFSTWQRQTCPVCAGAPAIAKITSAGQREAFCHRCSTQWPLPTDICGICGARDARSRLRLEMPGDQARRAEVCRSCRQVTKVVDEGILGADCDLYFEDVIMLPLDDMAREATARLEEPALSVR